MLIAMMTAVVTVVCCRCDGHGDGDGWVGVDIITSMVMIVRVCMMIRIFIVNTSGACFSIKTMCVGPQNDSELLQSCWLHPYIYI